MIATDYYLFRRLPETKSKLKFQLIGSTKSYEPLEALRATKKFKESATRDGIEIGDLFVYIGKGEDVVKEKKADRVPEWSMTKTDNITGIFIPDPNKPLGYGDMIDTRDLFLFKLHNWRTLGDIFVDGATLEVFVIRNGLNQRVAIYDMFIDGQLDDDIAMLRQSVEKEDVFKRWEGN